MSTFYEKIYDTKVVPNKSLKRNNYSGYPRLKAAGIEIEWTPEQAKEFAKCKNDCMYFIEHYMKVVHVDKGLINFIPYSYQRRIIESAINNRYTIAKLPRQSGKTTCVAGFLLWSILFNKHYNVAILANKETQAGEILQRIKLSYEDLPWWLQMGVIEWNKKSISLANGSKIFSSATSASAIRGKSINIMLLDEFAHVDRNMQEDFWTSVAPTISSGETTKILITSTPKGMELFYKIWEDAIAKKSKFHPIDSHWSEMPGRDEAWKIEQLKLMTERAFSQEFECQFLGSSNTLIDGSVLRRLVIRTPLHGLEHLKVYDEPIKKDPYDSSSKDHLYIVAVDTARGDNNDYSAFTVMDISTVPYSVVAVYRNDGISTLIFPNVVYEAGIYYNNAFLLIETNDLGQQVADILHYDLEYEYIIMTAANGRDGTSVSQGFGNGTSKLGVKTSKSTKRVGCSNLKTLVEGDKLLINDLDIIAELSRFALHGTSYKAQEGNDDLVMCCVIFSWFMVQPFATELTDMDIRKNLYKDNLAKIEQETVPFGAITYGDPDDFGVVDLPQNMSFDAWLMAD